MASSNPKAPPVAFFYSKLGLVMAGVLFFVSWAIGITWMLMILSAGGKPYQADLQVGRYFVKEKGRVLEVDAATYNRLLTMQEVKDKSEWPLMRAAVICLSVGVLDLFRRKRRSP